jgi:predicted Mrr-cat superfamily restriction endonuclease
MKTPLSERIRPNSEAAPWVIDEVKKLEEQNEKMLSILKKVNEYVLSAEETFSIYRNLICVNFLDEFEPETISDIRSIIQKVEGDDHDKQKKSNP